MYFLATWTFSVTILGFNLCTIRNTLVNLPPPGSAGDLSSALREEQRTRSILTPVSSKRTPRLDSASRVSICVERAVRVDFHPCLAEHAEEVEMLAKPRSGDEGLRFPDMLL